MDDQQTRRDFFRHASIGLGTVALAQLLESDGYAASDALGPKPPQFKPRAKNVIFMFMEGAPSQMDLFDPKPALQKWHGRPLPPSVTKDLKLAFIKPTAAVLGSPRVFRPAGQSGMELSDVLPGLATCADDICLVRSMYTEAFNHHPGQLLLFTGHTLVGRPAMGAWVVYGLGSESQDLPGFVVLASGNGTSGGTDNFASGFLPSTYAGTVLRSTGDPILYLSNPPGYSRERQRSRLDAIGELNRMHSASTGDAEIESRIHAYELAFRMQASAPDLLDFSKESPATMAAYGIQDDTARAFGTNCLLARRMVERGVRFVMLTHASWDHHSEINKNIVKICKATDGPTAALLHDLKQRGLLDTTLVVWGGEFGRTPMSEIRRPDEADNAGRDHHPNGFSLWLAGGGIKSGQVIGKTDDLGLNIVEDPIHIHDLQATILHCLGLEHTRLTFRYLGRNFRLTDVGGKVVQKLLA